MPIEVLLYQANDRPQLLRLIGQTIAVLGPQAYTADQVAVWGQASQRHLSQEPDPLTQGITLVAHPPNLGTINSAIGSKIRGAIGFGQLQPLDRVAMLYIAAEWVGQGVGKALYRQLETIAQSQGVTQLRTEASHLARPFFQAQGFEVQQQEWVVLGGMEIDRFVMLKAL